MLQKIFCAYLIVFIFPLGFSTDNSTVRASLLGNLQSENTNEVRSNINEFFEKEDETIDVLREHLSDLLLLSDKHSSIEGFLFYAEKVATDPLLSMDMDNSIDRIRSFIDGNGDQLSLENIISLNIYLASMMQHTASYEKALELLREMLLIDPDKDQRVLVHKNIGDIYQSLGSYEKSASYYFRTLSELDDNESPLLFAKTLQNLGNVYHYMEEYEPAIDYYERAIQLYDELEEFRFALDTRANLGGTLRTIGSTQQALEIYLNGMEQLQVVQSPTTRAQYYTNIGNIYTDLEEFDKALQQFETSLEISREHGLDFGVALNYLNIGYMQYISGELNLALAAYDSSMVLVEDIEDQYLERQLLGNYAFLYSDLSDYESAYRYLVQYSKLDRDIINEESKNAADELRARYETELKDSQIELQIAELEQYRARQAALAILIVFMLSMAAFIIYRLVDRNREMRTLYERNKEEMILLNAYSNQIEPGKLEAKQATFNEGDNITYDLYNHITEVMEAEEAYLHNHFTLEDLAERVSSNTTYVSKAISVHAKKNFNQFVNLYRVRRARQLLHLKKGEIEILELMEKCGFNSRSSFYRIFRDLVGMTPAQYVKQIQMERERKAS